MCCVRNNRGPAWRHGASPGNLNRVRHGFDRSYDLLSVCHHWRYAAWKSACAPGTTRLVSQFSFHHPWLAFVPAAGTPIDLLSQYSLNMADPVVAYRRHRGRAITLTALIIVCFVVGLAFQSPKGILTNTDES